MIKERPADDPVREDQIPPVDLPGNYFKATVEPGERSLRRLLSKLIHSLVRLLLYAAILIGALIALGYLALSRISRNPALAPAAVLEFLASNPQVEALSPILGPFDPPPTPSPLRAASLRRICLDAPDLPAGYSVERIFTARQRYERLHSDELPALQMFYGITWRSFQHPTLVCSLQVYRTPEAAMATFAGINSSFRAHGTQLELARDGDESVGHLIIAGHRVYEFASRRGRVIMKLVSISELSQPLERELLEGLIHTIGRRLDGFETG